MSSRMLPGPLPLAPLLLLACALACLVAIPSAASLFAEVAFEENLGQLPADAHFGTRADGFGVVVYSDGPAIRTRRNGRLVEIRMQFAHGNPDAVPIGEEIMPGRLHYYRGDEPADWQQDVRRFARIRYADVYPGIDAVLHDREGEVELDFEVAPDADPNQVSLHFRGIDRTGIESDGKLALWVDGEKFRFSAPEIYQRGTAGRDTLPGRYQVASDSARIDFQIGDYDEDRELVIDPVFLGFATHVGGSGSDSLQSLATDSAGNIYLTGSTTSTDFAGLAVAPVGDEAFVVKIDPTTQNLVYAAFFGGDGTDRAWAIEANSVGTTYVAGYTTSSTFPTLNGYASVPDNTDAFLLELDPNGTMTWGTVYGGDDLDGRFNGGIGIHETSGHVYIGSRTLTDDLTPENAFSNNCPAGANCAFVAGFDPSVTGVSSLIYATYVTSPDVGDTQEDGGVLDLEVDANENVYAFGFINPNSKVVGIGEGFQDASGDMANNDHFLVKLDPSLAGIAQRVYSTFIGGFGDEIERGRIYAQDSGLVFVGSRTESTAATFPIGSALQPANAGGDDGYVFKIDTNLSGTASRLWGTFLGSVHSDEINGITVDAAGDVWVAVAVSSNGSISFPQVDPLPGSGVFGVDDDAAVAQISSDGTTLLFSSSIAAGGGAQEQGIAVLPNGRIVIGGTRIDANFPRLGGLELYPTGGNEIALVGLDPGPDQGLVLEIDDTTDPTATGDDFAFQYLIRNRGTGDAANAMLTTDFPVGLSASLATAGCSMPGVSATCDLSEDIPRGGNAPLYIVASAASVGSYAVNATVSSDLIDPSPGDDSDSESVGATVAGSFPANLLLSDFDVVANSYGLGGFALDTSRGVLATSGGSEGEVVNLMKSNAGLPFQVEDLLGQGEIAFGFVDDAIWTPTEGDTSDLFGRDSNAIAHRVFAIVDSTGSVELRTARAFNAGRVIAEGRIPLGRPGLLSVSVTPTNAQILFDSYVVAEGDPFTTDFRDALPANVGNDFVISVGFGTEDRGAAVLSVPEPGIPLGLMLGGGLIGAAARRRRRGPRPGAAS